MKNYKKIADTALLAGRIMLESNAETYRVEETMEHILKVSELEITEAFVLTTGFTITLDDPSIEAITLASRVKQRSVNLANIDRVNAISRQLSAGTLTIDEAYERLKQTTPLEYSSSQLYWANFALGVAFTIMLGGNTYDGLVTCINMGVLISCWIAAKHFKISGFVLNVLACTLMAIVGSLLSHLFPSALNLTSILYGSVMPLVPGTLITNAIRDTFHGDYTSGVARGIEAIMVGFSIAIGVTLGVMIAGGGIYIR